MNNDIVDTIARLNMAIVKKINERNKSLGVDISAVQGIIIKTIIENGSLCQKDIECHVTCNKSTLSSILDTMERNNLITRCESSDDCRKKIICVTDKAKNIHKILEGDKPYMNNLLYDSLSKDEIDLFIKIANKLKCTIERN